MYWFYNDEIFPCRMSFQRILRSKFADADDDLSELVLRIICSFQNECDILQ